MEFRSIKIGKHTIKYPIIQGGMGVGISWSSLAGHVSLEGGLGVISAIGTGYYQNRRFVTNQQFGRPPRPCSFTTAMRYLRFSGTRGKSAAIDRLARISSTRSPITLVWCATQCEAGVNIIITGAGLPMNMPEYASDFPDVALVPIISSPKALRLIAKRWEQRYKRIPDAVVLEGPLSGGHQGFTYEQCIDPAYTLENLIKPVVEEARKISPDLPVFAAGGIWTHEDIVKFIEMGASGAQIGTRFIGTYECDVPQSFKELLISCKKEQIELIHSPVGYPARGIRTKLIDLVGRREGPPIKCVSNCVVPCNHGVEARAVGYCIADRLGDAAEGNLETGLFFTGSNGWRIDRLLSVAELMKKLVNGEDS